MTDVEVFTSRVTTVPSASPLVAVEAVVSSTVGVEPVVRGREVVEVVLRGPQGIPGADGEDGVGGAGVRGSARIYKGLDQTIPTYNSTQITFPTKAPAAGTMVASDQANALRAVEAGIYMVSVTLWLQGGAAGERNFAVRINGSATPVSEFGSSNAGAQRIGFSDSLILNANDLVTITGYIVPGDVVIKGGGTKDTGMTLTYIG